MPTIPLVPLVLAIDCLASAEYLVAAGFDPAVATYLALHTTTGTLSVHALGSLIATYEPTTTEEN